MINRYLNIYNFKQNIFLIGPCIPPIGGVSVHMDRLCNLLENKKYKVIKHCTNRKNKKKLSFFILSLENNVLHFHEINLKVLFLSILLKKPLKNRIVITDHNPRFFITADKKNKILYKILLPFIDHIIFVNDHIYKEYKKNGAYPKTYSILNGFLPPMQENEDDILKSYEEELISFIDKRSPLLIANASHIVFFNNSDLYGLDMCIDLIKRLKSDFCNIGMVFAIANEKTHADYLDKLKIQIKHLGIEENFYFLTGQKQLWPLFKRADLMVRPTLSDGYAISIEEALYLNCPALASDVCERPKGTFIFKNRDAYDFYNKSKEILQNKYFFSDYGK